MRHSLLAGLLAITACHGSGGNEGPDAPSADAPAIAGPALTASPGENVVHLTWTAVAGATSYNIYRSAANGTLGALVTTATATQLDDTSVTNFEPDWYTVTAVVDTSVSSPSNQAEAFGYDLMHSTLQRSGYPLRGMAYAAANANSTQHAIYVAVGMNGRALISGDGASWSDIPALAATNLGGIAFGNGLFAAVGTPLGGGTHSIFTSPDGVTWTARDSGVTSALFSITYAYSGNVVAEAHVFIAAGGGGAVVSSLDGITWTQHTCGTSTLATAATTEHSNGGTFPTYQYMAVLGGANAACYTVDGTTFTPLTLSGAPSFIGAANDDSNGAVLLLDGTGAFLIVPYNFTTHVLGTVTSAPLVTPPAGMVYSGLTSYVDATSVVHLVALRSDGSLFESVSHGASASFTELGSEVTNTLAAGYLLADAIGIGGTTLFVLGDTEQILRSTDAGATLSVQHDDPGGFNDSVAVHGGVITIDRGDGAVMTSTNGGSFVTGTTGELYLTSIPLVASSAGFSLFYVDSSQTSITLAQSTDGSTWTTTNAPVTLCSGCTSLANGIVTTSGDSYLVSFLELGAQESRVGITGSVAGGFTSSQPMPDQGLVQVWGAPGAYAGMSAIGLYTSVDGGTWTFATALPQGMTASRYFDDGAVKYVVGSLGKMISSTDGVTWTTPTVVDPLHRPITRMLRMGDHLVIAGSQGLLATSPDGTTWTPMTTSAGASFNDIAVTDRGLVAIGQYDTVVTLP